MQTYKHTNKQTCTGDRGYLRAALGARDKPLQRDAGLGPARVEVVLDGRRRVDQVELIGRFPNRAVLGVTGLFWVGVTGLFWVLQGSFTAPGW